ncbi:hypothetical protein [Thermococcus sp. 21S7]|uniref:hypothetical protein n=1 Tax=Thermococcus sp. 21S7 TaxID=1638221 RepID=UPI00143BCB1D|nr:hypothetical protein [Thermococcus sp. 21S7]NJE61970.1 hypothetical protein [Thermococcus sp. 21S7]
MDEESAIIGVAVVFLVLLSPILLYWTVAFLDTSGIDRHLPGTPFIAVSALVPVLIVSLLSFLVMRYYNKPPAGYGRNWPLWPFFSSPPSSCS